MMLPPAPLPIPLPVQTLYADLTQKLADPPATLPGSISVKTVKSRKYLYVARAEGGKQKQTSLGPADDPAVVERAGVIKREAAFARERRNTIAMLGKAGLRGPNAATGKVLEVVSRAGLFDNGLVLVGTVAFQVYPALLGYRLAESALMTQDADFVAATASVSMAIERDEAVTESETGVRGDLLLLLQSADPTFRAVPQLARAAPPSRFTSQSGFDVEMLTPIRTRNELSPVPLPALRAGAIPFHYLEFLVESSIKAVALYGSGVRVTVPRPARYAVHKLIVAQNRKNGAAAKTRKDLQQAAALFDVLDQVAPDELGDALEDARGRGRKWERAINASLRALAIDR
jgi:hypothetical protein